MELYEIKNGLEDARLLLDQLYVSANIEVLKREIEGLTVQTMDEHFWDDQAHATKVYAHLNEMKKVADTDDSLEASYKELVEVYEYVKDTEDPDFMASLEEDYIKFQKNLDESEKTLLFDQEYDHSNAIVEIHPGAGGTESQDWAEMLMRMYIRYGEKKGWKVDVDDYLAGDEAGLKSCSIRFTGYNAYGHLRAEKGVHRLVRISPFDSSKRRHTSFASVEVSPELDDDIEITIDPNTVVSCQSQRSQLQNREQAMLMLKSKLYLLMQEAHAEKLSEIQGEKKNIEWGSQIRSYVLHPYSMVKDNRSGYESNDPKKILDGDLDDLIYAYLRSQVKEKNNE